jgi:flagellar biosynthesis/type III secretory pathway M-ring protein FliF/YscJ
VLWYGWVLLAVAAVAVIAFIILLIFKSRPIQRGISEKEQKALLDAEREKWEKRMEIERAEAKKIEDIAKQLRDRLKQIDEWYAETKEELDAKRKSEFETYVGDPDILGAELDKLLGIGGGPADDQED